jgi:hypothetical protein
VLRLDDGLGQCEVAVEVENVCVGSASLSYPQDRTIAGRQDDGTDLMGLERVAHGRPRGVNALVEKSFLDRDKKMVSQDANEDVSVHALFEVMKDRPLGERRFHVPEGGLGAGEQDVDAPEFIA